MYTIDLMEHMFTQIVKGVYFLLIVENQLCTLVVVWKTLVTYSYPIPAGIETTFLDIFNGYLLKWETS